MSSIWWVVGLIVGMRAGRRISEWGDETPSETPGSESGLSAQRLAELLDGGGIPTPHERLLLREWVASMDDDEDDDAPL